MLINYLNSEIKNNDNLSKIFNNISLDKININCNSLNSDFHLDTFNYFPITKNNEVFSELFSRDIDLKNYNLY